MVSEPGVLPPGPRPGLLCSICPRRAVPHHTHACTRSPGSMCTRGNTHILAQCSQVHMHTHPMHSCSHHMHSHTHQAVTLPYIHTHHTHSCTLTPAHTLTLLHTYSYVHILQTHTPMHTCSCYVHSCAHTDTCAAFLPAITTCIFGVPEQQVVAICFSQHWYFLNCCSQLIFPN